MTENIRNLLDNLEIIDDTDTQALFDGRLNDQKITWEEMQVINADGILQNKKLDDFKDIGYLVADDLDVKTLQIDNIHERLNTLDAKVLALENKISELEAGAVSSAERILELETASVTSAERILELENNLGLHDDPAPTSRIVDRVTQLETQ